MTRGSLIGIGIFGLTCVVMGMLTQHAILAPVPAVEKQAPAVVLAPTKTSPNGGVIAAREPVVTPVPAQAVPSGAKVKRTAKATVKPTPKPDAAPADCDPVTVDVTLTEDKDGGTRMLFSSPDGVITDAVDHPVAFMAKPDLKWTAGAAYNPIDNRFGAWASRDIRGTFTAGVALLQERDGTIRPWLTAGMRF